MAVESVKHPAAFPCETCDCVNGVAPEPRWHTPGRIPATDQCYRYAVTPRNQYLLSLYPHFVNGHLYTDGGVRNQPAVYLLAMQFIRGLMSD